MYYFKSVMQWVLTIVIGSLLAAYIESQYFNDFVKKINKCLVIDRYLTW